MEGAGLWGQWENIYKGDGVTGRGKYYLFEELAGGV